MMYEKKKNSLVVLEDFNAEIIVIANKIRRATHNGLTFLQAYYYLAVKYFKFKQIILAEFEGTTRSNISTILKHVDRKLLDKDLSTIVTDILKDYDMLQKTISKVLI